MAVLVGVEEGPHCAQVAGVRVADTAEVSGTHAVQRPIGGLVGVARDHQVGVGSSDIGQHGSQGDGIPVDFGEDRNAQGGEPVTVWDKTRAL